MQVVAFYNLKGGVGKTSAAVNIAYLCSREARLTLLLDLDPQGSASYYFRARPLKKFSARILVEGGEKLTSSIRESDYPYLDILPADLSYRNIGKSMRKQKKPKSRLSKAIKRAGAEYDLVFIDCPPGIAIGAESVFRASDLILMPVIPTTLSLETRNTVLQFAKDKGLDTTQFKSFFSMVDRRKKLHRKTVETHTTVEYFASAIPYSSEIERMSAARQPICAAHPKSNGAKAYEELWSETKEELWDR